jgi:hypothetical protein
MSSPLTCPHPATDDFRVNAADWVEINCLFKADRNVSREDLKRELTRASAIRAERAETMASDAFLELEDRIAVCGQRQNATNSYPFALNQTKTVLQIRYPFRSTSNVACLYWFLLLISRMSMESKSRVLQSIDPTKVFEMLCADVLASFWAAKNGLNTGSFVFGTAAQKKNAEYAFKQNIEHLCLNIAEGAGWKKGANPPGGGDGKLDVVSWRKFSDGRPGNLIAFAQCKTGLNWKDHLDKLQPAKFSRQYMSQPLVVEPVKLYMVPMRIERSEWVIHTDRAGILLDRCRITQYGDTIRHETLSQCRAWARAAILRQQQLSGRKK